MKNADKESLKKSFDLQKFKMETLVRKRALYWKQKSKMFNIISTLSMLLMFALAYFAYSFIAEFIQNYNFLR